MRGDLTTFEIRAMYGEAFDKCTGCSPLLQETFMAGKEEFMIRTCNQPDYLEDLTGITKMN
jgi:ubiquitin-like modifier-activating enzyme ATG7